MAVEVEMIPSTAKKYMVILYRPGKPPKRDYMDPVSARARVLKAKEYGVDPDTFDTWCEETRAHGGSKKFVVPEPPASGAGTFLVRKMDETCEKAAVHTMDAAQFVKDVVVGVPQTHVAEWDGQEALCCLDVDYHESPAPPRDWLDTLVRTRIAPKPIAWHFSRSGGLHLFYVAAGDFAADELAAVAALRFRSVDRSAGLELKNVARGPGGEKYNVEEYQDTAASILEWLGSESFEEDTRDAWLDSEGMECGKRYDHDHCPIDPSPGAERQPVMVSEQGIYCFRCSGKGLTFGSRRPGWAPWPAILGSPSAGELGGLVRNVAHWGHAKWILTERYGLPEGFARLAYKAALRAYHKGKPSEIQLPYVFHKSTGGLARVNNLWMTIDDSHPYPKDIQPILRKIPQVIHEEEGKPKVDESVVCELNQTKDQTDRGYRNISVVHGFKLASVYLSDYSNQTVVAACNPQLRAATTRGLPKYVIATKRMPIEDAWQLIETVLPRIDRTYIEALILGFGCAQETRAGLLPIVFASGPSSVGKTAMAQVAAGIVGARVGAEATFDPEPAKFRAGVFSGGQEGPVVVFNELLKDATRGRHKITVREALDFVLNMTPHSTSHVLYRGPVKMGRLPALVITDTAVPQGLNEETQLARRIRHWPISGLKEEWKKTVAAAGITDLHLIRTVSDQVAKACDAIMSDIIDRFFSVPATWDEMADSLGVKTIQHSDEYVDPTPWLRELFRLVCAAPKLSERESKFYAEGYKKIERCAGVPGEEEADINQVYNMFCDGPGADWASSRRLLEKEWSDVLKVGEVVKLDLRGDSGCVYLRFRVGPAKKPEKVNQQIVDPKDWTRML